MKSIFKWISNMQKEIKILGRPLSLVLVVLYKGLLGLVEVAMGIFVLVTYYVFNYVSTSQLIQTLVAEELEEDPHDLFINWLLTHDFHIVYITIVHIAWFLLLLGILKLVVAGGVWFKSLLVRNISLVILSGVAIFGIYILIRQFSVLKLVDLFIELFILYYLWFWFPKQIKKIDS